MRKKSLTALKKYRGIYYRVSTQSKWRGRYDRCYWFSIKDPVTKINFKKKCGWASDGWTPEAAQEERKAMLEQMKSSSISNIKLLKYQSLTFNDFMKDYYLPWADKNQTRSCEDHSRYRCWLKAELGKKLLKEISSFDIERIKNKMKKAGRADATIRHVIGLVRHVFNKAFDWYIWEGINPCLRVKLPQSNNARSRFLTRNEAAVLLSELRKTSLQVAHVATFALYGGLRLSEVYNLKWADVDIANGMVNILDTKNGDCRHIFITEPLQAVLNELEHGKANEFLFQTCHGRPVVWLSNTYRRVVKKLGLNDNVIDRRQRVCFHTLRHTYASWAVMAGVPIYVIAKALGHKTIAMTQRYSHLAPDSHRIAFEAVAQTGLEVKV